METKWQYNLDWLDMGLVEDNFDNEEDLRSYLLSKYWEIDYANKIITLLTKKANEGKD